MTQKTVLRAVFFAGVLALGMAPGLLSCGYVLAAEEKQAAREAIGTPVKAAELLLKQKKYQQALAKLGEADAVANKTPYETYVIVAVRAAIYLETGDYPNSIKALEAALATGVLPPADTLARVKLLAQLEYQTKNYPKAVEYAERYFANGGDDSDLRLVMAQSYYLQNDFADAAKIIRGALQATENSGKPASQDMLLLLLNCEYQQKNTVGYIAVLKQLAATYPKKEYWVNLLAAVQRKPGFSGRLALDVDRLTAAVGAMNTPDEYMEAAQLALEQGFPGDAKSLLDKGYVAGVLGKGATAERQQRLATMAQRLMSDDSKNLPQLGNETNAANSGLALVKLGETFASYGRYDDAIDAFRKGLQKGGLKYPEDAKLHLGVTYLQAGRKAEARDILKSVKGTDGVQDLAELWMIESNTKN